jgi:hypothetical protein
MRVNGTGTRQRASDASPGTAAEAGAPRAGSRAALDSRVSAALRHVEGQLSARQLDLARATLRQALASDPVLQELGRAAAAGTRRRSVGR